VVPDESVKIRRSIKRIGDVSTLLGNRWSTIPSETAREETKEKEMSQYLVNQKGKKSMLKTVKICKEAGGDAQQKRSLSGNKRS